MTVTNSHAELPERDWTEHFPESPPDFRDGPDFRESIAPAAGSFGDEVVTTNDGCVG
jgi:hypothetical protein